MIAVTRVLSTGQTERVLVNPDNITHIAPFWIRLGDKNQLGAQIFLCDNKQFGVIETIESIEHLLRTPQ